MFIILFFPLKSTCNISFYYKTLLKSMFWMSYFILLSLSSAHIVKIVNFSINYFYFILILWKLLVFHKHLVLFYLYWGLLIMLVMFVFPK